MTITIRKSQVVSMKSFDNLFIELTSKCCNQRCKHCYINFPQFKKEEDFIDKDIIEKALIELKNMNLKCIYLTGAEPMLHPEFNSILRLCLKKTNVCICTNGSLINEKKARFLKKVEGESNNEIIFQISIDHYDEVINDDIRYRGAYRHAVFAVKHLVKYDFIPIISVTNYYKESINLLSNEFLGLFNKYGIDASHIIVRPWIDKNLNMDVDVCKQKSVRLDCEYGRLLTAKGIYSCPFLSNDYRGRCGSNFNDYAQKVPLETNFCVACQQCNHELFGINFNIYN